MLLLLSTTVKVYNMWCCDCCGGASEETTDKCGGEPWKCGSGWRVVG